MIDTEPRRMTTMTMTMVTTMNNNNGNDNEHDNEDDNDSKVIINMELIFIFLRVLQSHTFSHHEIHSHKCNIGSHYTPSIAAHVCDSYSSYRMLSSAHH